MRIVDEDKSNLNTLIALSKKEQAYISIKKDLERLIGERTAELNQANATLRKDCKRFEYLLSTSPAIIYATSFDIEHRRSYVSENVREIMGYEPAEMIKDSKFWITHIHPQDKQDVMDKVELNLKQGGGVVEYRFLHNNGKYMWVCDTHKVVFEDNRPIEIIGSWTDITVNHELMEDLSSRSIHDEVTGLINRGEFEIRLQHSLKRITSGAVEHVVCYLDIDQFRIINAMCGRVAGDELLRQLSKSLQEKLRPRDILARLGGDEFGILMEYCNLDQAHRVLEIIEEVFHEFRFTWDGKRHAISASIGVVPINQHSGSPDDILSMADSACYAAREAGGDQISIYIATKDSLGQQQQEMLWVERINKALEEDRFYLYYQPIVAINDDIQDEHYELLIRMKDEKGNIVSPGAFLPAAERYKLSSKIDRWVVQTIFSWLEAYSELLERENSWGINLSGQSLATEELLKFVLDEFDRKQIPPEIIYFEITETAAITNFDNAVRFINTLRDRGCRFALDDFGSGLSSFSYLKNLPVDFLKIDGVFVKNIANDNADFAIVKAINDVSHTMGKKTIAEFVENDNIIMKLKEIGVDYAQGYGIAKPRPLTEFFSASKVLREAI